MFGPSVRSARSRRQRQIHQKSVGIGRNSEKGTIAIEHNDDATTQRNATERNGTIRKYYTTAHHDKRRCSSRQSSCSLVSARTTTSS